MLYSCSRTSPTCLPRVCFIVTAVRRSHSTCYYCYYYLFVVFLLASSNSKNPDDHWTPIRRHLYTMSTATTPCWPCRQSLSLTDFRVCWTLQPMSLVKHESSTVHWSICCTPRCTGWTFLSGWITSTQSLSTGAYSAGLPSISWFTVRQRRTLQVVTAASTKCSKKVSPLMFGNDFGECWSIFKSLSPNDSYENLCRHHKDFHLTCNMLLHYLVKVENPKNVTKFSHWTWQLICLTKS